MPRIRWLGTQRDFQRWVGEGWTHGQTWSLWLAENSQQIKPLRHLLASMADAMNGFGEITLHSDALGNGRFLVEEAEYQPFWAHPRFGAPFQSSILDVYMF